MSHPLALQSTRALLAASALALLATTSDAQPGERRVTRGPLTATLHVSPASVAPGGSFTVRFALRNASRKPVRVLLSCTAPAYLALLPTGGGSESLQSQGCGQAMTTKTLAPGAEASMTATWQAVTIDGTGATSPLPSGRYVVQATPTVTQVDGAAMTVPPLHADVRVR